MVMHTNKSRAVNSAWAKIIKSSALYIFYNNLFVLSRVSQTHNTKYTHIQHNNIILLCFDRCSRVGVCVVSALQVLLRRVSYIIWLIINVLKN